MRGVPRVVAAASVAALLLAACDGDVEPEPIVPSGDVVPDDVEEVDPEPEPEAEEPEPAAAEVGIDTVPDDPTDIDEAYVQRVLDALDPLYGAAFATFVAEGEVTEAAIEAALQVFDADLASQRATTFAGELRDAVDGSGAPTTELLELQTVGTDCTSALVLRDVTGVFEGPGDPEEWYVALVPSPADHGTEVAWVLAVDVLRADFGDGFDGCEEVGA